MDNEPIEELIACAKAGVFLGGNDIKRLVGHYEDIIKRVKQVHIEMSAQADGVPA
jgi:hypothetical protein